MILEKDQITKTNFDTNLESQGQEDGEGELHPLSQSQFHRCPKCKIGYMFTIERLSKVKRYLPQRGPP
jgi:hypothetical protein